MCQYLSFCMGPRPNYVIYIGDGLHHENTDREFGLKKSAHFEWMGLGWEHSLFVVVANDETRNDETRAEYLSVITSKYATRSAFIAAMRKAGKFDKRHTFKGGHHYIRATTDHDDEQVEGHYRDGREHGIFRAWRIAKGKRYLEEKWASRDGQRHGDNLRWNMIGGKRRLVVQEGWRRGDYHGVHRKWRVIGGKRHLLSEINYRNGVRHGLSRRWRVVSGKRKLAEKHIFNGVRV
ncbi:MAG: hypothetical protein ABIH46_08100 [Chloroflexota bacterium]